MSSVPFASVVFGFEIPYSLGGKPLFYADDVDSSYENFDVKTYDGSYRNGFAKRYFIGRKCE